MKVKAFKILSIINVLPFITLAVCFLSIWLRDFSFWNDLNRFVLNQLIGVSLGYILIILCFYIVYRYCLYLKVSLIGLAFLNLYNISYYFFKLNNYDTYAAIIITTFFLLAVILLIKSKYRCTNSKKD